METLDDHSIIFKDGPNAVTALISFGGDKQVSKSSLSCYQKKIKSQYVWLKEHQHLENIPRIYQADEGKETGRFSYTMEYIHPSQNFFEYIHTHPIEQSEKILRQILRFMHEHIYGNLTMKKHFRPDLLSDYCQSKFFGKMEECKKKVPHLEKLFGQDKYFINGKECLGIHPVMETIFKHTELARSLATNSAHTIHGDLTAQNILVKNDVFYLIDPNDENHICDAIVDYAKLYQSFHSSYKFMHQWNCVQDREGYILEKKTSWQYQELFGVLQKELANFESAERIRLIPFHEAIHLARMLPYVLERRPEQFIFFYLQIIILLNDLLDYRD